MTLGADLGGALEQCQLRRRFARAQLIDDRMTSFPVKPRDLLAPIDRQEVWAATLEWANDELGLAGLEFEV